MHPGPPGLFALAGAAVLLAGCEDPPLAPDRDQGWLASSGAGLIAPSNLSAAAVSPSQIDLVWLDKSSNETGFEVHRSTNGTNGPYAALAVTAAGVGSHSDGGVASSTAYCYKIRAFRTTGSKKSYSAFSSASCATTPAPPPPPGPKAPPSGLRAVAAGASISLTWTDNSGDEAGFRVERSPNGNGPWTLRFSTGANATISGDDAQPEQQLCYRVLAFNKDGNSAPTNVDCTTVLVAPSNLSASQVDDRTINLTWTNRSTLADGVEVYRAQTQSPFTLIGTVAGTTTAYRDGGLTPNSTYWYMIRAKRQDDASDSYTIASASTATMPPEGPSALIAYPTSSRALYVTWQDNSVNESGYRIEQSNDGGTSWRTIQTLNFADQRSWTNESAATEQTVCYRVLAFNGSGESAPSNFACTAPPAAATDLSATRIDDVTVELTWRDNSGVEDGYDILRSIDGFIPWMEIIAHVDGNVTTFRDNTVSGFAYPYRVQPTRDGGVGDWSNYVEVTPY